MKKPIAAPKGLGASGRALWIEVVSEFDPNEAERVQLRQACGVVDLCDSLAEIVAKEGPTMTDPRSGNSVAHPCVIELRLQRLVLARLIAAMRIPDEDQNRPQRRSVRGVYNAARR